MNARRPLLPECARNISAILYAVRRLPLVGIFLFVALSALAAGSSILVALAQQDQTAPQIGVPQEPSNPPPAIQTPPIPQIVPPSAVHPGPIVILDPAHGGTDTGARGPGGMMEKDIVLLYARVVRIELERQGFRVLMTRNDDSNPSYDDRAAVANAHRDALFISFHIASTGAAGTVHTYYFQYPGTAASSVPGGTDAPQQHAGSVLLWEDAQQPFVETSRRYADVLQANLSQHFGGSPAASSAAAVRELRSVGAPAVAVEISSVSAADANVLDAMAQPLANSVTRCILAVRPAPAAGGN